MVALPPELVTADYSAVVFSRADVAAITAAIDAVSEDLRFEYLRDAKQIIERFAAECWTYRRGDRVPGFIETHARVPVVRNCYIPVEHLTVDTETDVFGIQLLAVTDVRLPPRDWKLQVDKPVGSVARVEVTGTDPGKMAARGRSRVEHALRILRVALREHRDGPPGRANGPFRRRIHAQMGRLGRLGRSWEWRQPPAQATSRRASVM